MNGPPTLLAKVRQMLTALSNSIQTSVEQAPERVRDLLKRLYHGLLHGKFAIDLGEYYTPDWLAERLLHNSTTKSSVQETWTFA